MVGVSDWRARAACAGTPDPEMFFPVNEAGGNPVDARLIDAAKAVCNGCPVVAECLEWALDNRCTHGVWGGLTGEERARVIKRGGRPVQAPPADSVLVERARAGYPVRAGHADRRRIVAALPDIGETHLGRVFGVTGKTIYNDRVTLAGACDRPSPSHASYTLTVDREAASTA